MTISNAKQADTSMGPVRSFRCSSCTRCFVAAGDVHASEIICICGAALEATTLGRGVYELRSAVPDDARNTHPNSVKRPAVPKEKDLGYGASHGLAPGHEGPTGPGDSPAK